VTPAARAGWWRRAPRFHRALLLAGPAALLAWFLVRGEAPKIAVALAGFAFLVVAAVVAVRQCVFIGTGRAIVLAAAFVCLGSCGAERWLFFSDLQRTQTEIEGITCPQARALESGGSLLGRQWRLRADGWYTAHPADGWRWIDLYVQPFNQAPRRVYSISAGAWTNDLVHTELSCD